MILTCPECSTRYIAKEGSIGPNGRTVRCAKCETTWFAAAETVDPDALALEDNQTVLIEPEIEITPDPQAELAFGDVAPAGAHIALRDRADAEKLKRRKRVIFLIWAVTIAILIAAAILAFVKRQDIVNRTPIAASVYQSLGIPVKQGGLDIASPETETLLVEGEPVLFVKTSIKNLTGDTKLASYLGFRLHNRSGEAVAEWYVETGTIAAGDVKTVETRYPNPPIDGVQLSYGFAEE
ncbi:MJ0042-type zinc finger domain-containing protein [Litorimonas sp. WD9-15]|uniref:MJ0042-type zinc finger domain-containing protein n=1 Tax=Litorimonas sp. WD9-15 TaxID=3418716 RepID=UPI003D011D43